MDINTCPEQTRNRRRAPAAFSLIEVLLAIGILAIGVLTVASLFPVAIAQQKAAADDVLGTNYGLNVIENMKALGKGDICTNPPFPSLSVPPIPYGCSTFVPVNLTNVPDAYKVRDPNGIYNFTMAYRRPSLDSPVEVAVFVYRQAPAEATAKNPLTLYSSPSINFVGGGSPTRIATAVPIIDSNNGNITNIVIIDGGLGYTSAPTITITPNNGGSGATATATISNGSVSSITVTANGSLYPIIPNTQAAAALSQDAFLPADSTVTFNGQTINVAATFNGQSMMVQNVAVSAMGSGTSSSGTGNPNYGIASSEAYSIKIASVTGTGSGYVAARLEVNPSPTNICSTALCLKQSTTGPATQAPKVVAIVTGIIQ